MKRLAPDEIPVVILAGGMGTRLREVTESIPKPLVEIGDKPILWHIMKLYAHHGFDDFVLCLGYKSWLIKEFFLRYREHVCDFTLELRGEHRPQFLNNGADDDFRITFAETGLTTATGARLWRVQKYIDADTIMFTYGDGIGAVDLRALLDFHYESGKIGTVTGVRPTSRYGEMKVRDGVAVEFNEKPTTPEGFVSGGFFVLQREIFDYMDDDPQLFFESSPLQSLARDGELAVYPHDDFWMGMDTYREYSELNKLWDSGAAPWRVWDQGLPARNGHRALAGV
jgi:glucose-1-phosphate cytidylyltransferase